MLALLLASCTLTRTSVDACATSADCRAGFGIGSVCNAEGFCEKPPPNPRCTRTFPEDLLSRPESYPNAIVIGSLVVSGIESQRARENATRLAATQVNEKKGLDGRLFGIVFCDVAEDPKYDSLKRTDAVIASGKYLADVIGAPAFVGPSASPDVLAVFNAVKDKNVLVISPSATSPELTGADVQTATDQAPGLLWRTAVPDTVQGSIIARHLETFDPPIVDVNIIFEKGAYGEGLERVFRASFKKNTPNVKSFGFAAGNTGERDGAIVSAGADNPQYVLFFSSQSGDQSAFVTGAAGLASYQNVKLFLSDTAANGDLLKNAAGASAIFPRIIGTRPTVPDPNGQVYSFFKTAYSGAFRGEDPGRFTFVPHAFDATWLVFSGAAFSLRREGKVTGSGIARGLRRVASAGEPIALGPATWERIANDLGADKPVNLVGASGNLDYDPATEETTGEIDIWKISADGQSIEVVTKYSP
jgi:ABC-type branched-subunit amino acid transport system substrate-binding protein